MALAKEKLNKLQESLCAHLAPLKRGRVVMGSLLISNAYWTLACCMGITLFEWVWKVVV